MDRVNWHEAVRDLRQKAGALVGREPADQDGREVDPGRGCPLAEYNVSHGALGPIDKASIRPQVGSTAVLQ